MSYPAERWERLKLACTTVSTECLTLSGTCTKESTQPLCRGSLAVCRILGLLFLEVSLPFLQFWGEDINGCTEKKHFAISLHLFCWIPLRSA